MTTVYPPCTRNPDKELLESIDKVTPIPWIRCADRMPPDDDTKIILNDFNNSYIFDGYMIHISWMKAVAVNHRWTPYTEETWRALNS